MRATAWNSGGAEGISYIIIPKGSPLKVKVASKQYLKTGDLMTDAWIKTGKKELFDGTGECVDMMNETLFPIAVTYEKDSNGNTNYVYALFDRKAAKKSLNRSDSLAENRYKSPSNNRGNHDILLGKSILNRSNST